LKAVHELSVVFDDRVFSLPTVQKAALKFTDNFSFRFELGEHSIRVGIRPVSDTYETSSSNVVQLLNNEVLDQHLRAVVASETEVERNLILAHAFSNTKLIAS
jgi:His-Xaa-Ser system protein HxsD